MPSTIVDVPGFRVGHAEDKEALTGCTVILCEAGAVGGVDQRGSAPGTRETDALQVTHLVDQVHGVLLTGGSAFGLDAASGVVRYLEEKGVGVNVGVGRVPIVPAAVLFDLAVGSPDVRPGPAMGYQACLSASSDSGIVAEGNVGAGTGATVGKILGMKLAMKSGIGTASLKIGKGVIVGAIVAVNAFGDVIDPEKGEIIAGARKLRKFADTRKVMRSFVGRAVLNFASSNTVIGVVATNAKLNKAQATKVAQMAHNGLARTIRPATTMLDGDTVFALSHGEKEIDVNILGTFAAQVYAQAILRGVRAAKGLKGLPAASDLV